MTQSRITSLYVVCLILLFNSVVSDGQDKPPKDGDFGFIERLTSTTITKLPSNCPQNTSQDSKKPCKNSKSTREFKSLILFELSCKIRLFRTLQREDKSNPALSVYCCCKRRVVFFYILFWNRCIEKNCF